MPELRAYAAPASFEAAQASLPPLHLAPGEVHVWWLSASQVRDAALQCCLELPMTRPCASLPRACSVGMESGERVT